MFKKRMTILRQSDGKLLLAGPYVVKPDKITGAEVEATVAQSDPPVPPWITTLKLPDEVNEAGKPSSH